ncbi:MAG: ATP-binding protein [Nanoarchaeota archaeon]|nr:ATP-binding protein [Nanoarchaeota archaeon]
MEDILTLLNPWWKSRSVKKVLAKEFRRDMFKELIKANEIKQITALYGLRRVGKSTLLFQLIDELINKKTDPSMILYFSFDQKVSDLNDIFSEYSMLNQLDLESGKYYFFLDEIQKLEDWQNKIKIYYDLYPNIKFFISGSSNLGLRKNASESLAGRIQFLRLEPLSFEEWLKINKIKIEKNKLNLYQKELRHNFIWYLKTPFPEIASLKEDILIRKYIDDFIVARILFYDISKEFKDVDIDLLETLKNLFFEDPGFIVNVDALARDLHRGKENILRHINYLNQGLITRTIKNYRKGELSSSRKLKKIYPYHPCFCYGIDESKLIENLIVSILDAKYYWREKEKEVDIIQQKIPIEVKYKNTIANDDLKNVVYFMQKFEQPKGIMITKTSEEKRDSIKLIPAWKVAFKGI